MWLGRKIFLFYYFLNWLNYGPDRLKTETIRAYGRQVVAAGFAFLAVYLRFQETIAAISSLWTIDIVQKWHIISLIRYTYNFMECDWNGSFFLFIFYENIICKSYLNCKAHIPDYLILLFSIVTVLTRKVDLWVFSQVKRGRKYANQILKSRFQCKEHKFCLQYC